MPNQVAKWPAKLGNDESSGTTVNHASCVLVSQKSPALLIVVWKTALPDPERVPLGEPHVGST